MNSPATRRPAAPRPRPRRLLRPRDGLSVALSLCCCAVALAQATTGHDSWHSPKPPGRDSDSVWTYREVLDSSLILLHTDRPDCSVTFLRAGQFVERATPVGPGRNYYRIRAFRIPPAGEMWSARISKSGYREITLSLPLRPREVLRGGVVLASASEADRLLFACSGAGGGAIASVLPDGSGHEVLVDTPDLDTEPAVAPDGYRVAFCTGPVGRRDIRVFDRRTGRVELLVDDPSADDHGPSWLDEETVVYSSESPEAGRVMRVRAGERPMELFGGEGRRRDPSAWPSRGTVLFATDTFGAGWDLGEGDPSTGAVTRLTTAPGDESHPVGQPGTKQLAYLSTSPAGTECLLTTVGDVSPGAPAGFEGAVSGAAWSADGRVLVACSGMGIQASTPPARWLASPVLASTIGGMVAWGRFARLPSDPPLAVFRFETGAALVELDAGGAPEATARFLGHLDAGEYDGGTVHRVVEGQVVQCGCPLGNGTGGGPSVLVERGRLGLTRGALAFEPKWQGQSPLRLLFCLCDLPELEGTCTAFGRVVAGLEALDSVLAGDRLTSVERLRFDEDEFLP